MGKRSVRLFRRWLSLLRRHPGCEIEGGASATNRRLRTDRGQFLCHRHILCPMGCRVPPVRSDAPDGFYGVTGTLPEAASGAIVLRVELRLPAPSPPRATASTRVRGHERHELIIMKNAGSGDCVEDHDLRVLRCVGLPHKPRLARIAGAGEIDPRLGDLVL
jgi:hypothetical protein